MRFWPWSVCFPFQVTVAESMLTTCVFKFLSILCKIIPQMFSCCSCWKKIKNCNFNATLYCLFVLEFWYQFRGACYCLGHLIKINMLISSQLNLASLLLEYLTKKVVFYCLSFFHTTQHHQCNKNRHKSKLNTKYWNCC